LPQTAAPSKTVVKKGEGDRGDPEAGRKQEKDVADFSLDFKSYTRSPGISNARSVD